MFVFGNIILGIAKVLDVVLNIYMWVIIIRALISWVNPDPYNPIVQILTKMTEPVLTPITEAGAAVQGRHRFFAAHRDTDHHVPAVCAGQHALSHRPLDGIACSEAAEAITMNISPLDIQQKRFHMAFRGI